MNVDVQEIARCLKYFKEINDHPIGDIVWMNGEEKLLVDLATLDDFKFTGLCNRDFPLVTGWIDYQKVEMNV